MFKMCRLYAKNQESQLYISVQVPGPENCETASISPGVQSPEKLELWCPKELEMDVSNQEEREFALPFLFCFVRTLCGLDDVSDTREGVPSLVF